MFEWLRNLFAPANGDVFRPKERLIYRYFDGEKEVAADPLELYMRVMEVSDDLAIETQLANSQLLKIVDVAAAHRKRVERIRKIFNIKPVEAGGLTGLEVADLLDHFLLWESRLKKNYNPPPTSPAATSVSTPSTSAAKSVTTNTSASGSIASAPSIEPPARPPTASELPLVS